MAGHGAYIKYQFLVAAAYSLFLLLLYINVCVQVRPHASPFHP
jgi:hypothetical protein